MKLRLFIYILLAIFMIPVVIWIIFFATGGIFGECAEIQILQKISPDEIYRVNVYTKDCGATTAISTHIAVQNIKPYKSPVMEDIFIMEGQVGLDINWVSRSELLIKNLNGLVAGSDIFMKRASWRDINIYYEGL